LRTTSFWKKPSSGKLCSSFMKISYELCAYAFFFLSLYCLSFFDLPLPITSFYTIFLFFSCKFNIIPKTNFEEYKTGNEIQYNVYKLFYHKRLLQWVIRQEIGWRITDNTMTKRKGTNTTQKSKDWATMTH
jgi:hypothetical protein